MESPSSIINENMSIHEILTAHPHLISLFREYGLGKFEQQEILEKLGPLLKLKTPLTMLGINREMFIDALNESIEKEGRSSDFTLAENPERQKDLTLLALLPCGLKMPFSRAFDAFSLEYNEKHGNSLKYLLEGNVNHELSYYQYIDSVESFDELPDVIISSDINSFYHAPFREHFLVKEGFVDLLPEKINADFENIDFDDTDRQFTMLSANLLVLVSIDEQLAGKPTIESWKDIMRPEFKNDVVMRGQAEFFCNGVLLPFYSMFGNEGVAELARSVRTGVHPSEMVKMIDSGKPDVASLYIMPYFFAQKVKNKERISIRIPKEGAIVSPVQMLVKKTAQEKVSEVTDFLCSTEFGQLCADAYFPSVNPEVKNVTSHIKDLYWLGWEFLKKNDVGRLKKDIEKIFMKVFRETGGFV
ncbi:ABC transporter substrate-binding protein [Maridesulfovibrio sp.]|uniref:ABC transporter substrate-binding protein n=1 Tax=Maridesulfovibrio sp. TaxID=2795000 RepID=UPI002A18E56D|nr:ABC transporter substrate-binding protein [Maridesulfovibrio sp.]